ncbi:hypothetical protein ACSQ67_009345 [Phaseolus vulgaris]
MRRSVRMNEIHTTLTLSLFLFIAFPHSHSQEPVPSPIPPPLPPPPRPRPRPPPSPSPPLPLCAEQSYQCKISVSAILDYFWEESPASQCNGGHQSSLLSCYASYAYQNFTVKDIDYNSYTMTVVPTDTIYDVCSYFIYDYLNNTLLQYYASVHRVTLFFHCPHHIPNFPSKRNFKCWDGMRYFEEGWEEDLVKEYPLLKDCKERLWLPTAAPLHHYDDSDDGAGVLQQALNHGFGVHYGVPRDCRRCSRSNGSCWTDGYGEDIVSCEYYCSDQHCSAPISNKTNVSWDTY